MTIPSSSLLKAGAFSIFPMIPVLVFISHYAGPSWLVPAFVFIGIPALDYLIGTSPALPRTATRSRSD
jgi:hypothetical protein